MVRDKNIGHCRVLKSGRIPYQRKLEKLGIKDGDFVDFYLQDMVQLK